ncbi:CoA ester lyase [Desulfosporosinus sp. PR]|uniref:HpcH/HpaI aldolase/citrate lyase family protein n=1 Tax=Candidatus Desulfosporosinus nitrosoreducens TaxID=3401928 RepID=UPI0027F95290|nr:CoA ester lyase [Desulfosporosinus sp. PR]MDQ7092618.1 CoA ester lyase [Desulfosporosinus sp. PR]
MTVMRSMLYVPGNDKKALEEALTFNADVIVLDLEDLVPPAEKEKARQMVRENIKLCGSTGAEAWVRVNSWETNMTNDDLEAVVYAGLKGINLTKVGCAADVQRLDWRLEELERNRGLETGSIKICLLVETALGIVNAYQSCAASPRVVAAIFGAVDYTRDMQVKLTSEAVEQQFARGYLGVAAKAARILAIDAPYLSYLDIPGFERNAAEGRQMGYKGRMIVHPNLVEASNRLYSPDPADVAWAKDIVKVFEEEAIAKGKAAVSFNNKMVDTPVYLNALDLLKAQSEIEARLKK